MTATNFRHTIAASAAVVIAGLGAFATMQPASAMPADPDGSPGTLSGNVVTQDPGQVAVTSMTQAQFEDKAWNCKYSDKMTVCQNVTTSGVGSNARVKWTTWVAVPQSTSYDVELEVGGPGIQTSYFDYKTTIHAQSPWVELDWESPGIPSVNNPQTDVTVTLDDGSYRTDCPLTYRGDGAYDMSECTPPTLMAP